MDDRTDWHGKSGEMPTGAGGGRLTVASMPVGDSVPMPSEAERVAQISAAGLISVADAQRYIADKWTSVAFFAVIVGAMLGVLAIFHG